ncbi:phosphate acetyltransferase [Haematospirillum sp. H1815]|uniref:phosphate acetyltransferase n=1 Tax=Haematospirillum sp. H1815 TaxID=2723108 RepID=UPI0014391635|nr:phosphate acetyltransferase [Haematospirillum sp. H1815]NKD77671.1 phosphate acetyltransferase [Haematospirillum sp. H1815]
MSSKTFFLSATTRDAGLTSAALGLARAFQRSGLKVAFAKPVAQPDSTGPVPEGDLADPSAQFARQLCLAEVASSIPFDVAEARFTAGDIDGLMEEVVTIVEAVASGVDVVVLEGLLPLNGSGMATALNAAMCRSLDAGRIVVVPGQNQGVDALAASVAKAVRLPAADRPPVGVLVNKHAADVDASALRTAMEKVEVSTPLIGIVPWEPRLLAPRLSDVVRALDLTVLHHGALETSRVRSIVVAAGESETCISRLGPGALVVSHCDRGDIALATALANQRGVPLSGLLLTGGGTLSPRVADLVMPPSSGTLPVVMAKEDTFAVASALSRLASGVAADDFEQMEQVIDFVAGRLDTGPLRRIIGEPSELRLSPPAFRYRLIREARKADKRIVLPEGDEPRTLEAAVVCHRKGIARCVLLGNPGRIREVAAARGLELPDGLEIVDPESVRDRYVDPLVELRKGKGLTAPQAAQQLEDTVVLGTVMLALDEVDGLVSGAVHTTANTVRPALQLIRTAPGASIVSSIFFMLMPDQVLVYGDCAINPDPDAGQLADIAIQSADSARAFGIDPRVAMISYSTGTSGSGDDVEKVRQATELARSRRPDLTIDGPMQYDAASVESVARSKAPDSPVAGRATVFVFPDLNTGNTTYKAVQRSAGVISVGPMLQGLRKPVNDLSRGALVDDIVYTIALTAIQAGAQSAEADKS